MIRHGFEPFVAQQEFLRQWIPEPAGFFWEWDAGDGLVGSHARILEEQRGWRGVCVESRVGAAGRLSANRQTAKVLNETDPRAVRNLAPPASPDLLTCRRPESQKMLLEALADWLCPRYLVWQARVADSGAWRQLGQLGYRIENFIHDDEYYRRSE